jgi:hypothetical protein
MLTHEDVTRIFALLALLKSAILSGEHWSEQLQGRYDAVLQILKDKGNPQ